LIVRYIIIIIVSLTKSNESTSQQASQQVNNHNVYYSTDFSALIDLDELISFNTNYIIDGLVQQHHQKIEQELQQHQRLLIAAQRQCQ
jgi:hypothetical protein